MLHGDLNISVLYISAVLCPHDNPVQFISDTESKILMSPTKKQFVCWGKCDDTSLFTFMLCGSGTALGVTYKSCLSYWLENSQTISPSPWAANYRLRTNTRSKYAATSPTVVSLMIHNIWDQFAKLERMCSPIEQNGERWIFIHAMWNDTHRRKYIMLLWYFAKKENLIRPGANYVL